jgi:hypothetical protein
MLIKVNGKTMTLVQLSTTDSSTPKGLYLVPATVSIDEFDAQVKAFDKSQDAQDDFDELNTIGAIRVVAYDCMLDLDNY